jgi:chromatin segregation and condensation protein Rec8/ScpA/Scc1 (kleisin family)
VVATFLALLELIRLKQLTAVQREHFAEIEIGRAPIAAAAPPETPAAGAPAPADVPQTPTPQSP